MQIFLLWELCFYLNWQIYLGGSIVQLGKRDNTEMYYMSSKRYFLKSVLST